MQFNSYQTNRQMLQFGYLISISIILVTLNFIKDYLQLVILIPLLSFQKNLDGKFRNFKQGMKVSTYQINLNRQYGKG
ncbi:unnamed protein product [Paramecium octaurelia]|uniref:Uncharacterized protein n=1 Tax=Paramecium octaurelia TaxID=43137 RepID=A0A8S1WM46_PAROT|nr:unnamed protein product [Paramecium octaurelia]